MSAKKRRSRLEVSAKILEIVADEVSTRTDLMYKARLSFHQVTVFLKYLLEREFIKEVKIGQKSAYEITEKGRLFQDYYIKLQELTKLKTEPSIVKS